MNTKKLLKDLKCEVKRASEVERAMNTHLGHEPGYKRGSLVITIRWDKLRRLVRLAEECLNRRRAEK
jgi:hypothetical protein